MTGERVAVFGNRFGREEELGPATLLGETSTEWILEACGKPIPYPKASHKVYRPPLNWLEIGGGGYVDTLTTDRLIRYTRTFGVS